MSKKVHALNGKDHYDGHMRARVEGLIYSLFRGGWSLNTPEDINLQLTRGITLRATSEP